MVPVRTHVQAVEQRVKEAVETHVQVVPQLVKEHVRTVVVLLVNGVADKFV